MSKLISRKTLLLVQLAVLAAFVILMAFTPLGYLRTPLFSITFIMIPVALGAILLGPWAGAVLGLIWGITSAMQYFVGDQTSILFVNINLPLYLVMCIVPRVLDGFLCGLIYRALKKKDKTPHCLLSSCVTSFCSALFNTVMFVGLMLLFFTDSVAGWASGQNVLIYAITGMVGINGIIEMVVATVVGAALARAVEAITRRH